MSEKSETRTAHRIATEVWNLVETSYPTIRNASVLLMITTMMLIQILMVNEIADIQNWNSGELEAITLIYEPVGYVFLTVMVFGVAIWITKTVGGYLDR